MTNKELEAKVINAQSAVAKREAVLAKHREQLAKLIAKGADQYDIRYKEDDIKTATGKLEDARRILKNWQDKLGAQISRGDWGNHQLCRWGFPALWADWQCSVPPGW